MPRSFLIKQKGIKKYCRDEYCYPDDVPYYYSDDSLNSPPSPTQLGYEKFYHLKQVDHHEENQPDHPPDKDAAIWKAYYTYMFDGRSYPQDHSLPSSITPTPTSPTSSPHPAMLYDNHWITQSSLFPFGFQELDSRHKARKSEAKDETSVESKKLVQCVNCKKEFDNTTSLEEHVKSTHKNSNRNYTCQYCSKSFSRSWNFQRHVLIHKGEKPHKCEKCPKAFVLAAHLKIHNRIHSGEKPYVCDICSRGFAQLTNLQRHVLTHTGQKPHKCTYCPKGFVSSSDLRRHVRIHTGERPYKCNNCPKAFTTSGNLHSHMLTHSGEKPFQCKICKWKFISSSNLRTHCRIHHKR